MNDILWMKTFFIKGKIILKNEKTCVQCHNCLILESSFQERKSFPIFPTFSCSLTRTVAFRIECTLSAHWQAVNFFSKWQSLGCLLIVAATSFVQIALNEWISFENVVLKIPSSSMVRSDCIVFMEPDVEGAYSLSGPSWSGISSSSPTWLPSLASLLSGLIALSRI